MRHESDLSSTSCGAAFHGLAAYLFCAFLLVFVGVGAMIYNIQAAVANFEYVLQLRLHRARGHRAGPDHAESLPRSAGRRRISSSTPCPWAPVDIVAGKYLALVTVFLVPAGLHLRLPPALLPVTGRCICPPPTGLCSPSLLLGAALIAVGMFISSLTENQGFAAGIGIAALPSELLQRQPCRSRSRPRRWGPCWPWGSLALLLGAARSGHLTRNAALAWGVARRLRLAARCVVYLIDAAKLEGLLPDADGEALPLRALLSLCERRSSTGPAWCSTAPSSSFSCSSP